jgi:Ser/Thr protein kinase RdoA (MazF antagonist)
MGALHRLLNSPAPVPLLPPPEADLVNQHLCLPGDFLDIHRVYGHHPHLEDMLPLIEQGAEAAGCLPARPDFVTVFQRNDVLIHGDPKADNFIFAGDGEPRALVDWDDARYGHLLIDVAEMLRSFGRPPELAAGFSLDNMSAVVAGYAQSGLPLSELDLTLLPTVLRAVCLNLARRYMTDALAEVFFRWDSEKYPSLDIQKKSRSQRMLDMAENILNNEMRLLDVFQEAYAKNRSGLP